MILHMVWLSQSMSVILSVKCVEIEPVHSVNSKHLLLLSAVPSQIYSHHELQRYELQRRFMHA